MSDTKPPQSEHPTPCKGCGKPIELFHWRDPSRCVECYLSLKSGQVLVCTVGDVRVGDCMPGTRGMATDFERERTPR